MSATCQLPTRVLRIAETFSTRFAPSRLAAGRARPVPPSSSGLRSVLVPLLAAAQLAACDRAAGDLLAEPPLPGSLEAFDERVVARIDAACERVREAPDDPATWAELGVVYEVESVRSLALACYAQALARDPERPKWWYRSAVVQWRLGDLRDAIARITRAIDLEPEYAPCYYRLGTFHLELGELDPAWEAFGRALELDPVFAGGAVGRARVHLQRDQAADAVEILESLIARDPGDAIVSRLLVTAYRQAGLERDLRVARDRGEVDEEVGQLWVDPWQAELREYRHASEMRRVTRLLRKGDGGHALQILERKREEDPDSPSLLLHLAEAYFQDGRIRDARRSYREYLEHQPSNVAARMGLARIHESQGLPHLAVQKLDEVIEIQPTYGRAYELKARILHENEQYEMAVPVIEKALEYDQRNPDLWLWLGHGRIALDRFRAAAQAFDSLLEQDPENGDAWLGRARAHLKLRELDAAERALERARELGTQTPWTLDQLDHSLRNAREREAARKTKRS